MHIRRVPDAAENRYAVRAAACKLDRTRRRHAADREHWYARMLCDLTERLDSQRLAPLVRARLVDVTQQDEIGSVRRRERHIRRRVRGITDLRARAEQPACIADGERAPAELHTIRAH